MPQNQLRDNDAIVARAYSLMAINGKAQVWAKYAETEVAEIINYLALLPSKAADELDVIDVGCGTGRHSIAFAKRGFKVRGYDFVDSWVERSREAEREHFQEISNAGGSAQFDWADARKIPAMRAAKLVVCLYDVIGSSEKLDDAADLMETLYRICIPGGHVVLSAMSGVQMLRGMPSDHFALQAPANTDAMESVNTMQRSGEVFEFGKMVYDVSTGALVRREQFWEGTQVSQDELIKEYRLIPSQVLKLAKDVGLQLVTLTTVRAGKWNLKAPSFDPLAPEVAYIFQRPREGDYSYPRHRQSSGEGKSFAVEVIPRSEITAQHASIVSRIFCADFGVNPKTRKPHVLGPARMMRRLQKCSYLCVASCGKTPVGYMFGTEYNQLYSTIAWLDSICVVRTHRRRGLATAMLDMFARRVPHFEWLGATSPNPITSLVLHKMQLGKIFGPGTDLPPEKVLNGLKMIANEVEDLRNCEIDTEAMRIKTRFTVSIEDGERHWDNAKGSAGEPAWWSKLANLPEDWEALLIIHRTARDQLESES